MGFFVSLNDGFAERGLIRNGLTSLSEAPLYFNSVMTYRTLYGLDPGYMKNSIYMYEPSRLLRSLEESLL